MNSEILTLFLANCAKDPALQDFARGRQLSFYYRLSNPDLEFFTVFAAGEVRTGLGKPAPEPDLTLQMTAETFDEVMSGRTSAMAAAMSGRMRFSGDTTRAMSAQRIQNDLIRLYSEAKEAWYPAA